MAAKKNRGQCTRKVGCPGMAAAIAATKGRTGIDFANGLDLKTGVFRPLGYIYRGNKSDPGILFNLCPFCGKDYRRLWSRK